MKWKIIITAALLAYSSMAEDAGAAKAVAEIPVVSAYGELLKFDPIDLGGGTKVRLGIEAKTFPRWSGVLLYCLAEGYDPPRTYHGPDNRLGPLHASYRLQGSPRSADGLCNMEWAKQSDNINY